MTAPLPDPDEFRARLAEMTASELAAAGRDPGVRACIEAGPDHAAAWREAVALHEALEAFDVPAPRANVAARTMAAIAKDERLRHAPSAPARVLRVLSSRVAVPGWAVAAAVALLAASAAFNVLHVGRGGGNVVAAPAPAPVPPLIVIDPDTDSSRVMQTSGGFVPPMAEAIPALVVIMGVPPDAGKLHPQPTDRASSRKESSI